LRLGGEVVQVKAAGSSAEIAAARLSVLEADQRRKSTEQPDLALITARCNLKARASRAFMQRRSAVGRTDEPRHEEIVRGLIAEGKQLTRCFLWMLFRERTQPSDSKMTVIAEAYANLASAAAIALRVRAGAPAERRRKALELLAEAQSALRVSLESTWLTSPDRDQDDAFHYLDDATTYERVFVQRYMRLDDPADPGAWEDLAARLKAFTSELDESDLQSKRVTQQLYKLRHHARAIQRDPNADHAVDWQRIDAAVAMLVSLGVEPDDPRVWAHVGEIAGIAPTDGGHPALARAVAHGPDAADVPPEGDGRAYSDTVVRARDLLRGKRVVLFGGLRRAEHEMRIRRAFDLADLDWLSVPEHSSSEPLRAPITRPETGLVLMLVRWGGHQHIDDVREWCERAGKTLVMLPTGYNPEQIAVQVLSQASGRLRASTGAA
jgi:hypothetical protein